MQKKYILKNNTNFYNKIFGVLIKKGKKFKILNILNSAFLNICKATRRSISYLLTKIFITLNVFVETRTVRTRRRINFVPFPLGIRRRIYLITKWIFLVINKNKEKTSFFKKFVKEILLILKTKKSEIFKLTSSNISKALLNRSNIHYRW